MGLTLPRLIFGSSALGNLYEVVPDDTKRRIVANWVRHQRPVTVIDSAGKYGAGLALESIGRFLGELGVAPADVLISNKLGWRRVPLTADRPTFEPGAWFGLDHDAEQAIGGDAILDCWRQGNALLGDYRADWLSVHDPDEYVAAGATDAQRDARYADVLDAYRTLARLRDAGEARAIGVGSKDWRMAERLYRDGVPLDWVMVANSFTIYDHPAEVAAFLAELHDAGVTIVNSAVFNAGFLIGGAYFDYVKVTPDDRPELFDWRDRFHAVCAEQGVAPAHACCAFALTPPGVAALALNTSRPRRVAENVRMVGQPVPGGFWPAMKRAGLLEEDYPYA